MYILRAFGTIIDFYYEIIFPLRLINIPAVIPQLG
jgi:hypothetical protein